MEKRRVAILGSTGSIGVQALDVISQNKDKFQVELLTANSNSALLIEQAIEFDVNTVIICDKQLYQQVDEALRPYHIKVFAGLDSIVEYISSSSDIDIVLSALVGFSGLKPALATLNSGIALALANKETLVAAGAIVMESSLRSNAPIIPVDSEHSAIFQSLMGENSRVEKLILTASGGPFRYSSLEEIRSATLKQALNHPNWAMGSKVTIDSASMMNKGLEMIEAMWLFEADPKDIEILIHPESIIHSMIQYYDGSVFAQMSIPDMRIPIQFALSYPNRLDLNTQRVDFKKLSSLNFMEAQPEKFPCLGLAYQAAKMGGNMACIMNAANEVAVSNVLSERLPFYRIASVVEKTMEKSLFLPNPTLEDIFETDKLARICALEYI